MADVLLLYLQSNPSLVPSLIIVLGHRPWPKDKLDEDEGAKKKGRGTGKNDARACAHVEKPAGRRTNWGRDPDGTRARRCTTTRGKLW